MRPSGSSLAIVNPGAPDAPPAVIHADDASIVATIWTWHARALETSRTEALDARREAVRCGEEVVAARLKLAEIVAEFSAGMFTPADFIKRAVDVDEALREIRERRRLDREERDAREAALVKAAKREDVPAELAPFAALSLADIGHAAWLCGYHPGDDPRKVFERIGKVEADAAKQDEIGSRTEAAEHALKCLGWLGDDGPLAWAHAQREKHAEPTLARMVQLEADVATLVTENNRLVKLQAEHHQDLQGLRDEAAVWRERFKKHKTNIRQIVAAYFDAGLGGTPVTPGKVAERLNELGQARRAMTTLEARLAAATAERDEFWTTLRAIGLRDAESLEEFETHIAVEFAEAKQWRENRADYEAMRELQKARNDLRVYETDVRTIDELASVAARLFDHLPESLEARSYDADRGASIAVRITRDPKRVRVETVPISFDLRSADPEKLAAVLSTPIEPRLLNKPVAKPGRNVMDEVRGLGEATERFDRAARLGAEQAGFLKHLAESARELGKAEGRFEDIDIRIVRVLLIPVDVVAAMFPLARRMIIIDQTAIVTGRHPRAHIVHADVQFSRESEQADVVCAVLPNGDINVLKNRRGQAGRWSFQPGVSFAEMVWTGTAWVPTKPPVPVAVGETEAGSYSKQETMDAEAFLLDIEGSVQVRDGRVVTGIDGPVPVRAAGWTGITWMSGKGRAKSLTLPGLRVRADLGPDALRSAEMESLSRKAIKVLQRRDRLYAFHLPGGVKRYGYVDTWGYLRAGEPLSISIRPPEVKPEAPKPARQGIAWRRPGHDVDSFAELPIRPTYDEGGNQVIEVHGELPEDLQHEIKQTSRDRPTITVTTINGATLKGPIVAWMRQNGPDGVLWRLTMPQRVPLPT